MADALISIFGQSADTITWHQMSARAVVIGLYAVLLYRIAPRRAFGRNSVIDIALTVIIGSALSRAMTGSAPIIPVFAATACLVLLHFAVAWTARRSPRLSHIVKGQPALLIADGKIDKAMLRRHLIGLGDLEISLHSKGIDDIGQVRRAYLERNGDISVIRN